MEYAPLGIGDPVHPQILNERYCLISTAGHLSYNLFIMFDCARLLLFLTAAVLLALAPRPGFLYVLARSLAGGKRGGVLSALDTFLGRR
jgi:hypothetical protein